MIKMKKRKIWYILTPIAIFLFFIFAKINSIPNTIFVREGHSIKSTPIIKIINKENKILKNNVKASESNIKNRNKNAHVTLFGMLPIKSVSVESIPSEMSVYPGGQPIGVKLNTKGVLIIALSDIETAKGKKASPAAQVGVQIGDSILKVNNKDIKTAEQLSQEINNSNGKNIEIVFNRRGENLKREIVPVKSSEDNKYKIGLWVRDSTAGVGTLTFYNEKTKTFAALGHPIIDLDTGTILNINYGEIVSSSIVSVRKGEKGKPGELKGVFLDEDIVLGQIYKNTHCGIFGKSNLNLRNSKTKPIKIALRNEIKEGPAKILTTINGEEPKLYNIEIQKLLKQDVPGPKSMIIKITDKELLNKTGGIVQGMSGSPIIQNNKLIGAVTHVLINKPDIGYGIYIEWMLKDGNMLEN
jgi:stage IV sporulation protein B